MCQIVMRDKKVLKFCHMVQFNLATMCVSSCEVALDIYNWYGMNLITFQTIFKLFILLIKNLHTYRKTIAICQFYFDFKMASTPLRTLNHPQAYAIGLGSQIVDFTSALHTESFDRFLHG